MTGPPPARDAVDHRVHRRRGRLDVVAVDRDVVDAVAGGALARAAPRAGPTRARTRRTRCSRRRRSTGQLPHRGEVDRLVERAVRHRAVAEERHRHAAVGAQLRRGRGAHGDREAGGHDAVGAEDAERRDRRCASSRRARGSCPASLRHQLGEHPERVEALGEAVTVAAMGRRDHVVVAERPARADRRCLLPDRQVHEARHLAVAVERGHALLEPADHEHAPMHLEEVGVAEHEPCTVLVGTKRPSARGSRSGRRSTRHRDHRGGRDARRSAVPPLRGRTRHRRRAERRQRPDARRAPCRLARAAGRGRDVAVPT